MSTSITPNPALQLSSSVGESPVQVHMPEASATESKWLVASTSGATANNRLALQAMQEEGPGSVEPWNGLDVHAIGAPFHPNLPERVYTFIDESDDGIDIGAYRDDNNDGKHDEAFTSKFDNDGNLRELTLSLDRSGDGEFDYFEKQFFDENGGLVRQEISEDLDGDGTIDAGTLATDTDGNGKLDTYERRVWDDQGRLLSNVEATDSNEDGIIDGGRIDKYDADGKPIGYEHVAFEGGLHADRDDVAVVPQLIPGSILSSRTQVGENGSGMSYSAGATTVEVSGNPQGGMSVATSMDANGDGELEAHFVSNFDENGTLRSNEKKTDHNADGVLDNILSNAYDADGKLISHFSRVDSSGNGLFNLGKEFHTNEDGSGRIVEQYYDNDTGVLGYQKVDELSADGSHSKRTISEDRDLNGIFEKETTESYDGYTYTRIEAWDGSGGTQQDGIMDYIVKETKTAQGSVKSESIDENSDGIVDVIFDSTYDQDGILTSSNVTFTEDGIYEGEAPENNTPGIGGLNPGLEFPGDEVPELVEGEYQEPVFINPTASAEFVSESAAYNNTLFTYDVDDQGNISNIRQIMNNSNNMSTGDPMGDVALLNGQPNLLLLPNGSDLVGAEGEVTIVDGQLHLNGQAYTGDAYFSHSAEMSTDGKQHFQVAIDESGHTSIKIEDLRDLGDRDFNDLEIKVLTESASLPIIGLTPNPEVNVASTYQIPDLLL